MTRARSPRRLRSLQSRFALLALVLTLLLGIALAGGASFIRVCMFTGAGVWDAGSWDEGCAADLMRRRKELHAEGIKLFADVDKKHSVRFPGIDLATHIAWTRFFGADALIVSGRMTGDAPDVEKVRQAKALAGDRPLLLAISDNGPQMRSHTTREFLAGIAIARQFGRPGVPQDQAWIETLFGHVKGEWPHLEHIRDGAELDAELTLVREHYNTVRLSAAVGYVTPCDEHEGRGEAIRQARRDGLAQARADRIDYRRHLQETQP